jgi:hypothetical protein
MLAILPAPNFGTGSTDNRLFPAPEFLKELFIQRREDDNKTN